MPRKIETLILLALPASGKSEVRKFLASMDPEARLNDFGIGPTLDLDDYPYVHLMRRVDEVLMDQMEYPMFYMGKDRPFQDPITWNVLIELLNEDYRQLRTGSPYDLPKLVDKRVLWLFFRMTVARRRLGMHADHLKRRLVSELERGLGDEFQKHFDALNAVITADKEGATVVIEFARGGPHGSPFPIIPPRGYASALQTLAPEILERACILYVMVTPEQARKKNIERGRPSEQGSILFHSVPAEVMLADYGCDDIEWMLGKSLKSNTIRVERVVQEGDRYMTKVYRVPVAVFDNRNDLTSFVREPQENWPIESVRALHDDLASAMAPLIATP